MKDEAEKKVHGELYRYFTDDHARLERMLNSGKEYAEFRAAILRHIWQEERLLMPAVESGQGGRPFAEAERLRLDHGAIAAILVPPPSRDTVAVLRHIFARHNPIEEGPEGLYELCEKMVGKEIASFMREVYAAPEIPTMPFNEDPDVLPAIKRAIARAGYDFDEIVSRG